MVLRKTLGWCLIALPFVAIFGFMASQFGFLIALVLFAISAVVVFVVAIGVKLLSAAGSGADTPG